MEEQVPESSAAYKDDDLVYVDPNLRTVVGPVEFLPNGKPKALAMKTDEPELLAGPEEAIGSKDKKANRPVRIRRTRYYPWGTYRSMKKVYKIEGKQPKQESTKTLNEVIELALKEPFWD
jgi:hypothetical protein